MGGNFTSLGDILPCTPPLPQPDFIFLFHVPYSIILCGISILITQEMGLQAHVRKPWLAFLREILARPRCGNEWEFGRDWLSRGCLPFSCPCRELPQHNRVIRSWKIVFCLGDLLGFDSWLPWRCWFGLGVLQPGSREFGWDFPRDSGLRSETQEWGDIFWYLSVVNEVTWLWCEGCKKKE